MKKGGFEVSKQVIYSICTAPPSYNGYMTEVLKMIGFCGVLDLQKKEVGFSTLRRMCGLHSSGCAFINREFGMLCDDIRGFSESALQPVTVSYNNSLYTAAVVSKTCYGAGDISRAVLEGYIEEGDGYVHRLDIPYALALYDGSCGELLLSKGSRGDKALFYTRHNGAVYFASALRPLMRLYGGCVRVNKEVLAEFLSGTYSVMPTELFCDIRPLRAGHSLICSRLGESEIKNGDSIYEPSEPEETAAIYPEFIKKTDIRYVLNEALFAFDYPQFDCFMPSLTSLLRTVARLGRSRLTVAVGDGNGEALGYYAERAERLGRAWGIDMEYVTDAGAQPPSRYLKAVDKELDKLLDAYLAEPSCILHRLVPEDIADRLAAERELPLRIRRKGMLCQTVMWFESFNIVLC